MRLHIANLTINLGASTLESANDSALAPEPLAAPPRIGEPWPGVGSVYAGLSRGEDGEPDGHLVLLDDVPESTLDWASANKWAEGLGDGARLPTRFESALLYANVRDKIDTDGWYWTGAQFSESGAWVQHFFSGTQGNGGKSAKARARAVRRFPA